MEQKPATSIVIGGPSYRQTALYWIIMCGVVVAFIAATFVYWRGTIEVIEANTVSALGVRRPGAASPAITPN